MSEIYKWLEERKKEHFDEAKYAHEVHMDWAMYALKYTVALNSGAFISSFAFQKYGRELDLLLPLIIFFAGMILSTIVVAIEYFKHLFNFLSINKRISKIDFSALEKFQETSKENNQNNEFPIWISVILAIFSIVLWIVGVIVALCKLY